ncbi:SAM-dependent methyltransferase [Streptomyces violaceus]|uniref:SAM-dependent methyltransferase n=1 Tax=Streptomyces violaceus TaxID=1936 RepID=A0ABZ1NVN5_STRVL|nr:N-6 DNA methylase [Streptomyces violaceus]
MSEFDGVFVSRGDIARLTGVKRPAVTNWERRHADFPQPLGATPDRPADIEVFSAAEILDWLDGRTINAKGRRSEEPEGTTYGDRFRSALGVTRTGALLKAVERLSGSEAERFRGGLSHADYITVLLTLVYVRGCLPEEWQGILTEAGRYQFPHSGELLVRRLASAVRRGLGPAHEDLILALSHNLGDSRVNETIRLLDDTGPVDGVEHVQAFEALLIRYSELMGRRAGDFFTPRAAVDVLTKLVADGSHDVRTVHDPFVRAGELLSAACDAVANTQGGPLDASGAGVGEHPLALAGMNLALHGVPEARLRPGGTVPSAGDSHGHEGFDRIVTNPPFNMRLERPVQYGHWRYGPPPQHNANFDWLQYVVTQLRPDGRAAVLMPDIAAFSANPSERKIRAAMVEDGAVEALVALPDQLFTTTGISVTIWLLRRPTGVCDEVLFIDARHLGALVSRVQRELAPHETNHIVEDYRSWAAARAGGAAFSGTEGLSSAVSIEKIREQDYTLSPAFHVPSSVPSGTRSVEPADLAALVGRLKQLHARAREADGEVEELLGGYGL